MLSVVARVRVKGATLRNILLAVERIAGKEASQKIVASVSPTSRKILEGPILVSTFWPVEVSSELHLGIREVLGKGESWEMNRKVGGEAARIDYGTIYRAFLKLLDYESTLDRFGGVWRQYNSRGEVRWTERKHGQAVCDVVDVAGFNEGQWTSIAGRMEAVILLSGAKRAACEVIRPRATDCTLSLRWTT